MGKGWWLNIASFLSFLAFARMKIVDCFTFSIFWIVQCNHTGLKAVKLENLTIFLLGGRLERGCGHHRWEAADAGWVLKFVIWSQDRSLVHFRCWFYRITIINSCWGFPSSISSPYRQYHHHYHHFPFTKSIYPSSTKLWLYDLLPPGTRSATRAFKTSNLRNEATNTGLFGQNYSWITENNLDTFPQTIVKPLN